MLRTWRNSPRLFSDFNTLAFASVMGMVLFVLLLLFMPISFVDLPIQATVDLPKVSHPVSMAAADREDAMLVAVARDGKVYLGGDQITADFLGNRIRERLKDRDVERKVYIKADSRARWGSVKPVLDGVRSAGVLRVAFLVDQRKITASTP
jgi:biopolymer transport protein ExbD/biopolymer transport protein TolR